MTATNSNQLRIVLNEHDDLQYQIEETRQFWYEVSQLGDGPKYDELRNRMRQLKDLFAEHFQHDELDCIPGDEIEEMESQHGEFLNSFDQFIQRLTSCEVGSECWDAIRFDFEHFVHSFTRCGSSDDPASVTLDQRSRDFEPRFRMSTLS